MRPTEVAVRDGDGVPSTSGETSGPVANIRVTFGADRISPAGNSGESRALEKCRLGGAQPAPVRGDDIWLMDEMDARTPGQMDKSGLRRIRHDQYIARNSTTRCDKEDCDCDGVAISFEGTQSVATMSTYSWIWKTG